MGNPLEDALAAITPESSILRSPLFRSALSDDDIARIFETKLSPDEEKKFQAWKRKWSPNDSGYDYDLRGAFKQGLTRGGANMHFSDLFKKPNHPTFSVESKWGNLFPERAGSWDGENYIPPSPLSGAFAMLGIGGR